MTLATELAKISHLGTREAIEAILTTIYAMAEPGTAVNAVASTGTLTIDGVVIDGETVTIGSNTYEFDTDGSVTGTNKTVDISAAAVAATGTLTYGGVAIDGETVTIGTEVYEIDWDGSVTGGNIAVDVSSYVDAAQGTLTISGVVVHNETFSIDGTDHTFKTDGTTGAGVIDISSYTVHGTAVLSMGGDVADTETVTISGRVYEFDTDSTATGDVAVDVSGGLTKDLAGAALANAINGDASAVVTAVYDADANELTVTAKIGGTVGNYTTAETVANASWSGNLTGGANCSAADAVTAILADFSQTGITATQGAGTTVVLSAYGTAGDALTFAKSMANGAVDGGGTLGGTQAGTDCPGADAATALIAAITSNSALVTAASGGAGVVGVTAITPGAAGNVDSTQTCANGAWGAALLQNGADCAKGDAQTALRAAINADETNWQLGAFAADDATLTAQTKGTGLNGVTTTVSAINTSWAAAVTAGGVAGTVAAQWDILVDGSYIYVAVAANTVTGANWKRGAISTF